MLFFKRFEAPSVSYFSLCLPLPHTHTHSLTHAHTVNPPERGYASISTYGLAIGRERTLLSWAALGNSVKVAKWLLESVAGGRPEVGTDEDRYAVIPLCTEAFVQGGM